MWYLHGVGCFTKSNERRASIAYRIFTFFPGKPPHSAHVRASVDTGVTIDFTVNYDQRSDKYAGVQRFMS